MNTHWTMFELTAQNISCIMFIFSTVIELNYMNSGHYGVSVFTGEGFPSPGQYFEKKAD